MVAGTMIIAREIWRAVFYPIHASGKLRKQHSCRIITSSNGLLVAPKRIQAGID